jgi:hypothetical protein
MQALLGHSSSEITRTFILSESRMNFLLLILLDISAYTDDASHLTIARKPLEALISDWLRQGEEIRSLRALVAGHHSSGSGSKLSAPSEESH